MKQEQDFFNQKLSDVNTKSLYVYKCGVHQPLRDGFNYFQISLDDTKKYIEYVTQLFNEFGDDGDGDSEYIWFITEDGFKIMNDSVDGVDTTVEQRNTICTLYKNCFINDKPHYCDDILYLVSRIMKNRVELSYLKYREYGVYYESYDDFWFFTFKKDDLNKIIPPFFLQD